MSKKGFAIEELLRVLLAVVIVLFLLLLGGKIIGIFEAEPKQGTKESFKVLNEKIRSLEDGRSTEAAYFVEDGFALAAFNRDSNLVEEWCGINDEFKKPVDECGGDACLIICDENLCKKIYGKETYKDIAVFMAKDLPGNFGKEFSSGDEKGQYVVMYGDCGTWYYSYGVKSFTIRRKGDIIFFEPKRK